ncbi:MAG: hypothetical protein ACI4SL_10690 [Candidatus Ornithospirochaeta sp.]
MSDLSCNCPSWQHNLSKLWCRI